MTYLGKSDTMAPIAGYELIRDLAVILVVSALMALAFKKLKQPLIIGYIAAGILIGPSTWPGSLILNQASVNQLAQIGVIMLLFVVGLEFPVEKLAGGFRKVVMIAAVEVCGTFAAGGLVGLSLRFSLYDALFAGLAITVTSTVVVSKVMTELGVLKDDAATLVVSVSIVEDVMVLTILAVLQSIASVGQPSAPALALSLGLVVLFFAGALVVGGLAVPRLINWIGGLRNDEIMVLAMLGIAFGMSIVADLIGISVATGGFLAGVLVARSDYHEVSKFIATPLRDMFAALFFVSMGALMDVTEIPLFIVPALILVLVSISMKIMSVLLTSRALRYSPSVAVRTAFGLSASGGELGLVVAKGGIDVGAASTFLLPMLGVITVLTTFLSPYVIKIGWRSVGPAPSLEKVSDEAIQAEPQLVHEEARAGGESGGLGAEQPAPSAP